MRLNSLLPVSVDTFGFTVFFADFASCPRPDDSQRSKYEESADSLGRAFLGGEERGLFWTLGLSWECARQPAAGMSQRSTGHTAKKEPVIQREVLDFCARQSLGGRGVVCAVCA